MSDSNSAYSDIGQFGMVPRWVLDLLRGESTAIHVWCVLSAVYSDREGISYPSKAAIARHVGVSTSTIDRAIAKLADVGVITVHERPRPDRPSNTNVYELHYGLSGGVQQRTPRGAPMRGEGSISAPRSRSTDPDPQIQIPFGEPGKDSPETTQHKTVSLPKIHRLTEQDISELRTEFSELPTLDSSLERLLNNSNLRFQRNQLLYARQWLERDITMFRAARHKPGRFVNSQNDQHIGDYERLLQERDAR